MIATDSINNTITEVQKIERGIFIQKEEKERLEEIKEAVNLLSF